MGVLGVHACMHAYNIKSLEKEGAIKTYKAVFNYKKIDEGFCAYILIDLSFSEYRNPERVANELAKHKEVESVDIIAGEWDMIVKVRTKDQDEYYDFLKVLFGGETGLQQTKSLISVKQFKTEFVSL